MECVYCAVRTGYLNVIQVNFKVTIKPSTTVPLPAVSCKVTIKPSTTAPLPAVSCTNARCKHHYPLSPVPTHAASTKARP